MRETSRCTDLTTLTTTSQVRGWAGTADSWLPATSPTTSPGEFWRRQRRLLTPPLASVCCVLWRNFLLCSSPEMPLWTSDQSSSVTAVTKSGTSSANHKFKFQAKVIMFCYDICHYFPLLVLFLTCMWDNDISLCLWPNVIHWRVTLCYETNLSGNRCFDKKYIFS